MLVLEDQLTWEDRIQTNHVTEIGCETESLDLFCMHVAIDTICETVS